MIAVDAETLEVRFASDTLARMLGYRRGACLVGRDFRELVEDDPGRVRRFERLASGRTVEFTDVLIGRDGRRVRQGFTARRDGDVVIARRAKCPELRENVLEEFRRVLGRRRRRAAELERDDPLLDRDARRAPDD